MAQAASSPQRSNGLLSGENLTLGGRTYTAVLDPKATSIRVFGPLPERDLRDAA
jgi:hypothetical protein